jgi:hypothetical protein
MNNADSWVEVKQSIMNGAWKKLCPQYVPSFKGLEETPEIIIKQAVEVGRQPDFKGYKPEVSNPQSSKKLVSHFIQHSKQRFILCQI